MITVICGTHRPKNQTLSVVNRYSEILEKLGQEVKILKMDELPEDFLVTNTFGKRTHGMEDIIHEKLVAADKFVIISPEYNGSYPGLFKAFLDAVKPHVWKGKKVALVGVAVQVTLEGWIILLMLCTTSGQKYFHLRCPSLS